MSRMKSVYLLPEPVTESIFHESEKSGWSLKIFDDDDYEAAVETGHMEGIHTTDYLSAVFKSVRLNAELLEWRYTGVETVVREKWKGRES